MTSITITGKAYDEEHREHAFVRYANGDDFDGNASIRLNPARIATVNAVTSTSCCASPDTPTPIATTKSSGTRGGGAHRGGDPAGGQGDPSAEPQLRRGLGGMSDRKPDDNAHDAGAAVAGDLG